MSAMIGWVFVVISGGVLVLTFPAPKTGGPPLAPSLIPIFGVPFAILYAAAQYGYVLWLRSRKGVVLVTVVLLAGAGVGWFGRAMDMWGDFERFGVSYARHILASGACLSGVILGIALIKTSVYDEKKPPV